MFVSTLNIKALEFDRCDMKQDTIVLKFEVGEKKFYSTIVGTTSKLNESIFMSNYDNQFELKVTVMEKDGDEYNVLSSSIIHFREVVNSGSFDKWYKIQSCRVRLAISIVTKESKLVLITKEDSSPVAVVSPTPTSPLDLKDKIGTLKTTPNPVSRGPTVKRKESGSDKEMTTAVILTEQGDKYVGKILNTKRHGIGEVHYCDGTKYFGEWKLDMMDGFGVYICSEHTYQGAWQNGEREGFGIMLYMDGTVYEGNFHRNVRSGEGKLLLPNGDKIAGVWTGDNVQGTYKKGSLSNSAKCSIILLKEKLDKIPTHSLAFGQVQSTELINNWDSLFRAFPKLRETQERCKIVVKDIKNTLSININDARELLMFLIEKLMINDLSSLIETFIDIFNWKYAKSEIVKTDLPQALDDLFSFIDALYYTIMSLITMELADLHNKNRLKGFIKTFMVKKVYKRLFSIYTSIFKEKDAGIKYKILALQSSTPKDFGVAERLIPKEESPFSKSIHILEKITSYQTPTEKFDCLLETSKVTISDFEVAGLTKFLGSDDLFPIHLYILTRAKIPHLWSLLQFLHDFSDESVVSSERFYRVTVFELTIEFIDKLESNLRDDFGVLIPLSLFENDLGDVVTAIYKEARKENKNVPYLSWISTLFIEIGSMLGVKEGNVLHPESIEFCDASICDYAAKLLKIGGIEIIHNEKDEYDVKCFTIYPMSVYYKLASCLEKLLEEISI